ncbi:FTR1 family iron permease [Heyndrickxia acidicola]|uniref:FTR1 family protein n=1 Tax=Heyndrickxia acidicola TaxID=209389 RepID=A0ABU6MGG9_9BACI|nr:FTR1 family protein [Heyndrickxia acidicola]MED1203508.1 FTR1 family protein [Heyndrickxia acidicola]
MLGSFLIFFRESLEASMICSIMLAYLNQIGKRNRFKDVWIGIWAAIAVAVIGGIVVFSTLRNYDGSNLQTKIEGITYFIACGVLTYMTFWMKKQGRNLKKELHAKMDSAISTGSILAISFIAFITVGREGLETVVFMIAIAFHTNPLMLVLGALLGVIVGLILSYVIYFMGRTINLKYFFDTMGTLLMLFAAGLLSDGIENFQELGWLPSEHALWNTASLLSEDSTFGDILHSFFGYADSPTPLQIFFYVGFLVVAVWLFWRTGSNKNRKLLTK